MTNLDTYQSQLVASYPGPWAYLADWVADNGSSVIYQASGWAQPEFRWTASSSATTPAPPLSVTTSPIQGGGVAGAQDGRPGASHVNPCGVVRGTIGQQLLAAVKCTALTTYINAKCGVSIALLVNVPGKILKAARAANGLYRLSRVPKRFRPIVRKP